VIDYGDAVQECAAGLLAVSVDADGARISGGPPSVGPRLDALALAEAVGLTAADVDPVAEPGTASAGLEHVFLPVHPDALARARVPEAGALRAATGGLGMVNVVALDLAAGRVRSRMFGPGVGVNEDPATGSAALALAVFAVDRDLLPSLRPPAGGSARLPGGVRPAGGRPAGGPAIGGPANGRPANGGPANGGPANGGPVGRAGNGAGAANGTVGFRIEQGVEMGRPSVLEVEATVAAGVVSATSVRGRVVPVAAGQIAVPPSGCEPR
jgi:predicted PhzF superfamily epimerase YddE/YHI9